MGQATFGPARKVTCRALPPSVPIIHISGVPVRLLKKAIDFPSGENYRPRFFAPSAVSCRIVLPSARTMKMSSRGPDDPNATHCPSGERLGRVACLPSGVTSAGSDRRSEEHTSELQSLRHLVCRLL